MISSSMFLFREALMFGCPHIHYSDGALLVFSLALCPVFCSVSVTVHFPQEGMAHTSTGPSQVQAPPGSDIFPQVI